MSGQLSLTRTYDPTACAQSLVDSWSRKYQSGARARLGAGMRLCSTGPGAALTTGTTTY